LPEQGSLPGSLKIFYFKKSDGGALVLWIDRLGFEQVEIKLPGINHMQHNIRMGTANGIDSDIVIKAVNEPIFITWQNSPDSLEDENPVISGR
jgi:hypothetical protein